MTDDLIDLDRCAGHAPGARSPRSDGARFATALAAATLLHLGVFVAFAWVIEPEVLGANGADAAASSIEVTLVSARALESREKPPTPAAIAMAYAAVDGSVADALASARVAAPVASTEAASATAEDASGDLPTDRRRTPQPAEVHTPLAVPARDAQPLAAAAQLTGGATARSVDRAVQPTSGAAAASPGAVAAYARAVASALGHTRPKAHASVSGTVRIRFAIGETGGVDDIVLEQSSGRTALDTVAIEAVRRTRFPAPPNGLTPAQRTFEVPYHFR